MVTTTTTWDELTPAALGTQVGERYGELPVTDWAGGHPHGLGLANVDDYFTVVYDGELYLPDGPTTLQLVVDDDGFVEIDLGEIQPTLRGHAGDDPPHLLTITPPAAGWYPIRGAMSEDYGNAEFVLSTVTAGQATPITSDHVRARVTSAQGMVVVGASDRIFQTLQPGSSIEPSFVDATWGASPPTYDLYGIAGSNYALRYAAQLRIDTAGTYTFIVDVGGAPTDYARLFIDNAIVSSHWPGEPEMPAQTAQLEAGWHDLVLDYGELANAHLALTMTGPGGSAGPAVPVHVRPVRAGGLLASVVGAATQLTDATASGPGVTIVPLALTAPGDATVDFVDFAFGLANEARGDLAVQLAQPAGSDTLAMPAQPAYENAVDYMPDRTRFAGMPVATTWQAVFTDSVPSGSAGQLGGATLVASYHGGPLAPFAQTMTYTSAPHATAGASSIDAITVTADLRGAALAIEVRTAPDAESLADAPWASLDAVAADAVLQYRLTIVNDGWHYPTVDKIEIDYTVGP